MNHPNSVAAWKAFDPGTRNRQVCETLAKAKRPVTDREIATKLGSQDMNYARPSITGLIDAGYVVQDGDAVCAVTHRTVRRVRLATDIERSKHGTQGVKTKHHGAMWRTMCSDLGLDPALTDPSMVAIVIRGIQDAEALLQSIADKSPMYSQPIQDIIDKKISPYTRAIQRTKK